MSDATLKDYDTLDDIITGASDEATNTGYARKVLTNADLSAIAVDDTNDRFDIDIPDQTWTSVQTTGGAWSKILVCYDADTTGGTDSSIVPLTAHDVTITPDGNDITLRIATAGFYRAS